MRRKAEAERAAGRLLNAQRVFANAAASCTDESAGTWMPRLEIAGELRSARDLATVEREVSESSKANAMPAVGEALHRARAAIAAEADRRKRGDLAKSDALAREAETLLLQKNVPAAKQRFEAAAEGSPFGGFHLARAGLLELETGIEANARRILDRAAVLLFDETGTPVRLFDAQPSESWPWAPAFNADSSRVLFREMVLSTDLRLGGALYDGSCRGGERGPVWSSSFDADDQVLLHATGQILVVDPELHRCRPLIEGLRLNRIDAAGDFIVADALEPYRTLVFDRKSGKQLTTMAGERWAQAVRSSAGVRVVSSDDSSVVVHDTTGKEIARFKDAWLSAVDAATGRIALRVRFKRGKERVYRLDILDSASGKTITTVDSSAGSVVFEGDDLLFTTDRGIERITLGGSAPTASELVLAMKDASLSRSTGRLAVGHGPDRRWLVRDGKAWKLGGDFCSPLTLGDVTVTSCAGDVELRGRGPKPLVLKARRPVAYSVAVSPDGGTIAFTSDQIYTLRTDGDARSLGPHGHPGVGRGVAFSRDGRMVSISQDGVVLWNSVLSTPTVLARGKAVSVAISASGDRVAAIMIEPGDSPGVAYVFDTETKARVGTVRDLHSNTGSDLAFSPDEAQLLAPMSKDCENAPIVSDGAAAEPIAAMCLYGLPSMRPIRAFESAFASGTISAVGTIFAGSYVETPQKKRTFIEPDGYIAFHAAANATGTLFAYSDLNVQNVTIFDPTTRAFEVLGGSALAFDPKDRFVAVSSVSGDLLLYTNDPNRPALRLAPTGATGGYVEDAAGGVEFLGDASDKGLFCRFGHYLLPFEACRGNLERDDVLASVIETAKLDIELRPWTPPGSR